MAKPKHEGRAGEKYTPVPVNPRPAPTNEVQAHLRAFVTAFISRSARHRWEHCLLIAPEKAREQLPQFHLDLDPAYCTRLRGAQGFPLRLAGIYGDQIGIYFSGEPDALLVTTAEAAVLVTESGTDALLSLVPGRRVLCFDHGGGIWACER